LILVQISDIHCGPQFRKEIFDEALREINNIEPDCVIITGDLTEEGLVKQYQQAKENIDGIKAQEIVICSGNHDYRSTGYYLFKHFFEPKQFTILDNILFVTLSTARPERDDGEVGFKQIMWLRSVLNKNKDRHRIVAMHHHVLPVPDTGTDRIRIVDAGDLLRVLARSGVELELCGHRHRPWIWNLENFNVVNAGTLSSERTRGFFANSYNIIEIDEKGIKTYLKTVGGKKTNLRSIMKYEYLHLPPKQ
jgi:3',5'-cyclic AMP phosphodiesterase CpdA